MQIVDILLCWWYESSTFSFKAVLLHGVRERYMVGLKFVMHLRTLHFRRESDEGKSMVTISQLCGRVGRRADQVQAGINIQTTGFVVTLASDRPGHLGEYTYGVMLDWRSLEQRTYSIGIRESAARSALLQAPVHTVSARTESNRRLK